MSISPEEIAARRNVLAEELTSVGVLDTKWRDAFFRAPRHLFVPDRVWREANDDYAPLIRSEEPEAWWEAVYSDQYIVTQVDDGREPEPGQIGDVPTSSASMPSLAFWMLRELDVPDRARVLEIGTGTGYNAALLVARVGSENVTTIEVDTDIAEQARSALAKAGFHPAVIAGDGANGYPPNAPYDRVIATCSVQRVPYAWIDQTNPGGVIITPWGTAYHNNALVRLECDNSGRAQGPFVGGLAFMWLRSDRVPRGRLRDFVHHEDEEDVEKSTTEVDPDNVFGEEHAEFAIGVQVPGCQHRVHYADDDSGEFTLWLLDPDSGSWASVDYERDASVYAVHQHGPRRLWNEVEGAYRWWLTAGRPERERFGLTVTPHGQTVWLDDPNSGSALPRVRSKTGVETPQAPRSAKPPWSNGVSDTL